MAHIPIHDEQYLLQRTGKGDERSFKLLVDRYWQKIYGHALAYSRSVPVAEEITQDIFTIVWTNREKLTSLESFPNWLFIITRNKLLKAIRQKLAETSPVEGISVEDVVWQPDKQLEYREVYALVLKAIELLPPVRKRVFTLSRMEGMSYDEIGKQLNISRNTVKEHIVKALNFLRNYFVLHHGDIFLLILTSCVSAGAFFHNFFFHNHPAFSLLGL